MLHTPPRLARAVVATFLALAPLTALAAPPPRKAAEPPAGPPVADIAAEAGPSGVAWERTLERSVPAVVAIRISSPRAFDTESAASGVATGFVVDKERGIVLTNRHVVEPGPVVAEAVFLDHEEVPLRAVYRDPVHDFGFYQFDPAALKYMDLAELPLEPSHARVGVEIRVVGNDAGEKISILGGTLARLDRAAPEYGRDSYNDFNTFYYQAASSTSGGSSGSPVLDLHGHVIALNAGGSHRAASSFFLPLDRVVEALDRVRAGQAVSRGTWQAVLQYQPYDEVRRLGVRAETEQAVRAAFPEGTGMLVVDETVPGGPAWAKLEPGDVLVRVGGKPITTFVALEAVLDGAVGASVPVEVERGGKPVQVDVPVQDLHAITPASYLEYGGGVVNPLSFQQARNHAVPVAGVYVAYPGHSLGDAGVPPGAVLTEVAGQKVGTLEALEAALAAHPDGARVPVRFFDLRDPRRTQVRVVRIDRRWFPMQRCVRDDTTGLWPCTPSAAPPPERPPEPASTTFPPAERGPARALAPSLVWVEDTIPYRTEGVYGANYQGTGIVVDVEKGLVLVDRDTVPISLGDVTVTFAGSLEVPAKVAWLHPTHNLALVKYDPRAIGDTPVRAATFSDRPLDPGDKVWHVGLTQRQEVVQQETRIARREPIMLSLTRPPFFRDTNLEVVATSEVAAAVGGALTDRKGRIRATWASFVEDGGDKPMAYFRGIPAEVVAGVVEMARAGDLGEWRGLGAELVPITLAEARDRGLSEAAAARLEEHAPKERQVLEVARLVAGTPAATALKEGDLLLAVDGAPAVAFREVERAASAEKVRATVLRDGKEIDVEVATTAWPGTGVERAVVWAGALLHAPHLAVAAQQGIPPEGVYVSWSWFGAPAARYGLRPTARILEVDGTPVPTLDAFLEAVAGRPDGGAVRLRTVDLDGKVGVLTLKLDLNYWPTAELVRGEGGWTRRELDGGAKAPAAAGGAAGAAK